MVRDVEEVRVDDLDRAFEAFHALLVGHAYLERPDAPALFGSPHRQW